MITDFETNLDYETYTQWEEPSSFFQNEEFVVEEENIPQEWVETIRNCDVECRDKRYLIYGINNPYFS